MLVILLFRTIKSISCCVTAYTIVNYSLLQSVIPMFTANCNEAFRTLGIGRCKYGFSCQYILYFTLVGVISSDVGRSSCTTSFIP